VYARLDRADAHVAEVEAAITAYRSMPPWIHSLEQRGDGATITERIRLVSPPPVAVAVILSDAVHQLRAALDNLIGVMRPGGPTQKSGFPIRRDGKAWEAAADAMLDGVTAAVRDEIRWMQPFSDDAFRWAGDSLVVLHDLARRDRHRAPIVHAALARADYAEVSAEGDVVAFRGDRLGTWAETEYLASAPVRAHFKVVVQVDDPEVPEADGFELVALAQWLARETRHVVIPRVVAAYRPVAVRPEASRG
jgi:hypothetical protein